LRSAIIAEFGGPTHQLPERAEPFFKIAANLPGDPALNRMPALLSFFNNNLN
jgi:hypothetical protein